MSFINPFTVGAAAGLALILFAAFKPAGARWFLGVFFLVMALGVNLSVAITNPALYVAAGANAWLPLYDWFFSTVLAWNPLFFAILLILVEATIGLLILSKGRAARLGILGGALFCLALTPIGLEELTAPLISAALLLTLRAPLSRGLFEAPRPV